jgi:hypothetical protein
MERSKGPSNVDVFTAGYQLAKLLLFVSPEQQHRTRPDRRLDQLANRFAKLANEDATTKQLMARGSYLHEFLKTLKAHAPALKTGQPVVEQLAFHSSSDRPVADLLIRRVSSSLCGRPDIQTEQDLQKLAYPTDGTPLKTLLTYENFEELYAVRGTNPAHRRGILLPVVGGAGSRVSGTYVEYASGGLDRTNSLGSMPFYISFVVLPMSLEAFPPKESPNQTNSPS